LLVVLVPQLHKRRKREKRKKERKEKKRKRKRKKEDGTLLSDEGLGRYRAR